jgi:hypothetical protein
VTKPCLKLKNTTNVPPGGYQWYCHDTQKWYGRQNNSLAAAVSEATVFHQANHFPVPQGFARRIEQELCEKLGDQWCQACHPDDPVIFPSVFSVQALKQGTATLAHLVARKLSEGRRILVEPDEVVRRARACCEGDAANGGRCRFNAGVESIEGVTGCQSCGTKEEVRTILGKVSELLAGCPSTPYDSQLAACKICACPLRSKVCVPVDIILEHMPASQQAQLPAWCWIKNSPQ